MASGKVRHRHLIVFFTDEFFAVLVAGHIKRRYQTVLFIGCVPGKVLPAIAAVEYYELIQINFDRVRDLRQQIEFARCRAQTDAAVNDEVNRLTHLFDSENVSFEEFDDVIIRRLVECIRVMPKDRVILTTKGGLQIERQS